MQVLDMAWDMAHYLCLTSALDFLAQNQAPVLNLMRMIVLSNQTF